MESLPPEESLCSIHSPQFSGLLQERGISLVLSTYQAGKLVLVRVPMGGSSQLNTHFRSFRKPMGVALSSAGRLAVGTATEIHEFQNVSAVAAKLEPAGSHDACFLPRLVRTTGDVQIHEMAYCRDELWFVNTRFSCLCTCSDLYSFVPRWRPAFISGLAPQDRCHLNGMGLRDGRPHYVTAHARSDSPAGWRETKKDGGILIDVFSNEVIVSGLSMPHSPRWHNGQLWLLNSGTGTIGVVDVQGGRYCPVAELPGFTRGLDFHGPLAFIGLSQVRETAVFSGIPLTERPLERACGVWILDTRSGEPVAALRFRPPDLRDFVLEPIPQSGTGLRSSRPVAGWCRDR